MPDATDTPNTNDEQLPMCRACGIRGYAVPATHVLKTPSLTNWYMCDNHAQVMLKSMILNRGEIQLLPNHDKVREYYRSSYY